jgi:putative nucleotidyltransferase with HDIG domain
MDFADEETSTILVGVCYINCAALAPVLSKVYNVHHVDHCFCMVAGREFIEQFLREGAYLLTPGWLEHWEHHVTQWGFDQQNARAFFHECTRQLVLLDTGVDSRAATWLDAFAAFLDLPSTVVPVGLDHLRLLMQSIILQWRLDRQQSTLKENRQDNRRLAEYTMAFDVMTHLTRSTNESMAIQTILTLPIMIFGAGRTCYIPVVDGRAGAVITSNTTPVDLNIQPAELLSLLHDRPYVELKQGFCLRIAYQNTIVGILVVDEIPQTERMKDYLNLALTQVDLCGLTITNTRAMGAQIAFDGIVQALASTSEWRDPYTAGHQRRVAELAMAITEHLGGSPDDLAKMRVAGLLHDLGKIVVPAEILSKPGKLLLPEFDLIKLHPQVGYEILRNIKFAWPIAQIVRQHHLWLDGTGYPGEVLFESRILTVADVVEAMSSHRPYRPAQPGD